jgi:hypothetical protein
MVLQSRCKLCGLNGSDSRRHLLTRCRALDTQRSDCQLDLHSLQWKQCRGDPSRFRPQVVQCAPTRSVELFMLGELNCGKSSSEQPSVVAEITSMLPFGHPNGPNNPHRNPLSARLTTRERILSTSCGCAYPTLPIQKRLTLTAVFIQSLFRARFPSIMVTGQSCPVRSMADSQSLSDLVAIGSSLSVQSCSVRSMADRQSQCNPSTSASSLSLQSCSVRSMADRQSQCNPVAIGSSLSLQSCPVRSMADIQ